MFSAWTPTRRTSGRSARSAIAIPDASPPPPIGITSVPHVGQLLGELEPDRPLSGDHALVLEGVHERRAGRVDVLLRRGHRLVEADADELDPRAVVARRVDLRHRRVLRHEDRRGDPGLARRPRDRLAVVACARGDDAGRALLRRQRVRSC